MDQTTFPNSSGTPSGVPQNAESFRTVPNDSESFGKVPHGSETFRTVPNASEDFGKLRHASERKDDHTITVREAARLFEMAGVARTERSIVNWCQPNRMGVARLDSYFDPNVRKYFISQQSIDQVISEERAKASKQPEAATSEPVQSVRKAAEPAADRQPERETEDTRSLKQEVMDLKITNRAKDMFIDQLKEERQGFAEERQEYVKQLMSFNHRVGQLETKLRQLEAPKKVAALPEEEQPDGKPEIIETTAA